MRKMLTLVILCLLIVSCASAGSPTPEVGSQDPTATGDSGVVTERPSLIWNISQWVEITHENAAVLEELATLEGHAHGVAFIVINPSSTILASSSDGGRIRLWDLRNGSEIAALAHGPQTAGIAISPGGNELASCATDRSVRIWDIDSGTQIREFDELPLAPVVVDWSPGGELVAGSARDHIVRVWRAVSGELIHQLVGHTSDVYAVEFDPRGDTLATGSLDGSVTIWDLSSGKLRNSFKASDEWVFDTAFSADGTSFAACGGGLVGRDNSVRIFDSTSWDLDIELSGFGTTVVSCFFSADGELLITRTFGGELQIWDLESRDVLVALDVPSSWLSAIALDPAGRFLAAGGPDGVIHIFGIRPKDY